MDDELFAGVYEAFLQHQVLLFRNQNLSSAGQVRFGRRFGTLQVHVMSQYHADGHPELYRLSNLDEQGQPNGKHPDKGTLAWHTDGSWERVTGHATILYSELAPAPGSGGETHFCDAYAAWDALRDEHPELAQLQATHNLDFSRNRRHAEEPLTDAQRAAIPAVTHPVVRVHPETGRQALYLGDHAESIIGMDYKLGRTLIDQLNDKAVANSATYAHRWSSDELMIWDNRCVMHRATSYDTSKVARVIRRCTVIGESPVGIET